MRPDVAYINATFKCSHILATYPAGGADNYAFGASKDIDIEVAIDTHLVPLNENVITPNE
jgi:hypothetical protein